MTTIVIVPVETCRAAIGVDNLDVALAMVKALYGQMSEAAFAAVLQAVNPDAVAVAHEFFKVCVAGTAS